MVVRDLMNNLFSSCKESKSKADVKGNGGRRNNKLGFGVCLLCLGFNVFIIGFIIIIVVIPVLIIIAVVVAVKYLILLWKYPII